MIVRAAHYPLFVECARKVEIVSEIRYVSVVFNNSLMGSAFSQLSLSFSICICVTEIWKIRLAPIYVIPTLLLECKSSRAKDKAKVYFSGFPCMTEHTITRSLTACFSYSFHGSYSYPLSKWKTFTLFYPIVVPRILLFHLLQLPQETVYTRCQINFTNCMQFPKKTCCTTGKENNTVVHDIFPICSLNIDKWTQME